MHSGCLRIKVLKIDTREDEMGLLAQVQVITSSILIVLNPILTKSLSLSINCTSHSIFINHDAPYKISSDSESISFWIVSNVHVHSTQKSLA